MQKVNRRKKHFFSIKEWQPNFFLFGNLFSLIILVIIVPMTSHKTNITHLKSLHCKMQSWTALILSTPRRDYILIIIYSGKQCGCP